MKRFTASLLTLLMATNSPFITSGASASPFEDEDAVLFQAPIRGTQETQDWLYHPDSGKFVSPKGQVIEPWNQPKEIRELRQQGYGLDTLQFLLASSVLRINSMSNGELTLYLSGRLRGGMMQGAQRVAPIIEKGVDKLNRVVVPLIMGGLGALGIQGTRDALNQRRLNNAPPLDLMEHLERQQDRQRQEPMLKQVPKPRTKPMQRDIPIPRDKPLKQTSTKPREERKENLYEKPIRKKGNSTQRGIPRAPLFPDCETWRYGGGSHEINQEYQAYLFKEQLKKNESKRKKWAAVEKKKGLAILNLDKGKHPKWVNKLLDSLPLIYALVDFQENVLSHPDTLITDYPKNLESWTETPKIKKKIKSPFNYREVHQLDSLWRNWAFNDVSWYKGEKPKCPRKLKAKEKENIFKYWRGLNKNTLGLVSSKDLIQIDAIKKIGGKYSRTFELTISSMVVPHTIVNKEILDLLKYMGKKKIRFGKSQYTCDLNARGQFALKDHKRGIVLPPFPVDRKQTNDLLPTGYKSSQKDRGMGAWLIKRYWDSRLNLSQALTRGLGDSKVDPMHRVLAENRTTGSLHDTFGIVANAMGPGGLRKLSVKLETSDRDLSKLLFEAHQWLGLFKNPNKYFKLSMEKPIAQFKGERLTHTNVPAPIRKQWWTHKGFENFTNSLAGTSSLQDSRNGLCYPLYSVNYKNPQAMLPRGYEPIKEHELLGEGFMRATGRYGQKILEEVIGIPREAQASYGKVLTRVPGVKEGITEGGKWLSTTVGFGLANMIDTQELRKRVAKYLRNAKDNLQIATKNFIEFVEWSAKKHQESFPIFDPQGPTFEDFPVFDGDKMKKFITWVADEDQSKILATYGIERGVQILSTPEIDAEDFLKQLIHMNITKDVIDEALEIKRTLNGGKNSLEIKGKDRIIHYDLDGASHKGIPTPHKQYSYPNTDKEGRVYWNKDRKVVEPITKEDLEIVREYLKK